MQSSLIPTTAAERYKDVARTGKQRKADGQDAAMRAESERWKERAIFLLRVYVKQLGQGAEFAFEDVHAYLAGCGLAEPHTHHVWGALPGAAIRAGIPIRMTDRVRPAMSPRTKGHRVSVWLVTGA
jgi:hypothetical protein